MARYVVMLHILLFMEIILLNFVYARRFKRQGAWFGQPKPPGKRCLFNPCESGNEFCKNSAECDLDESSCMPICHCRDNFSGIKCETKIVEPDEGDREEDVTKTSPVRDQQGPALRHIFERTCRNGMICIHGYCNQVTSFDCVCDSGWAGHLCDRVSKATLTTQNPVLEAKEKEPLQETRDNGVVDKVRQLQTEDACSPNYILRSLEVRECVKGVMCMFGVCTNLEDNKGFRCECDHGAAGSLCDKKCCKNCGDHGMCTVQNGTEYCTCKLGLVGDDCTDHDRIKDGIKRGSAKSDWCLWLVGVCACVLILLLVMAVILPYLLWYNRNKTMMKAVYSFQPFEDNDDMEWDAFVSYKSDGLDENFVMTKLKPVLEGDFGFKLCLPERDFDDGKTLGKNILNAVVKSRRIILILTPRYIQSEFTRYEYHSAQQEFLKRKTRIIPIILDDITAVKTSTDPILKKCINHVKSLNWSNEGILDKDNTFWDKVKLSMPKRRTLQNWSKGMRKIHCDNYLNDKQIVLAFSENDKFVYQNVNIEKKDYGGIEKCEKNVYENVAFQKCQTNEN